MLWTTPEFEELSLAMEVTAYVNTDADGPPFGGARGATEEVDEQAASLAAV